MNQLSMRPAHLWLILLGVQFISMAAMEMSASQWGIYVKQILPSISRTGYSLTTGAVYTLPPLLSVISIPIWGRLGDRFGHRKMIIRTLVALFVSQIVVGVYPCIETVIASKVIQGVFAGFLTAQQAYALGFTKRFWDQAPGKVIAQLQMMTGVAGIVGPSLGGKLVYYYGFETMVSIAGVACLLCVLPVFLLPGDGQYCRERYAQHKEVAKKGKPAGVLTLTILTIFVMMALLHIAKTTERPFFGPYVSEVKHMTTDLVGYFSSANALGLSVSAPLWMMLVKSDKRKIFGVMLLAALMAALIFYGITHSSSAMQILALRFAWGCCLGALMPMAYTLCTLLSKTQNYGLLLGLGTSAVRIGGTGGMVLGSALLSIVPMEQGLYVVCGLYLLAAASIALVFLIFRGRGVV